MSIEPGQSLGLMIRGGVEYNLGIFITGVDKDSVADRAGLMVSHITFTYISVGSQYYTLAVPRIASLGVIYRL